jgi:hypothetical protein
MNVQSIQAVQSCSFAQTVCYLRGGLKRMNGSIPLDGQCGQAEDSGVGAHIQDNVGVPRLVLPTLKNFFLKEVRTEKVELPLQHFTQIAWHLEATMLQISQPSHAMVTDRGAPE